MNLKKEIEGAISKSVVQKIADFVGTDHEKFRALMTLFFAGPYRITQRAAWVLVHCADKDPALVNPYLPHMIKVLKKNPTDAVKRNVLRTWQFIDVPDKLMGEVSELCFQYLENRMEPVAVKVFSMSVLLNITRKIPELKNELKLVIEDQLPFGSPGFRARANKVLAALDKIRYSGL